MTTNVLGKNLTARELRGCTAYINKKLYRIDELTTNAPADAVHLHVTAEKFATKAAFKVTFDLRISGSKLHVFEDSHGLHEAVDLAIDKLVAQLKHHADRHTSHERRTRATRRALKADAGEEKAEPDAAVSIDAERREIFRQVQPLLPRLTKLLDREIERLEMAGTLLPGQLVSQDVLDALIIDLYERAEKRPADLSFPQWAEQRARFHLSTMSRREQEQGIHLTIEDVEQAAERESTLLEAA